MPWPAVERHEGLRALALDQHLAAGGLHDDRLVEVAWRVAWAWAGRLLDDRDGERARAVTVGVAGRVDGPQEERVVARRQPAVALRGRARRERPLAGGPVEPALERRCGVGRGEREGRRAVRRRPARPAGDVGRRRRGVHGHRARGGQGRGVVGDVLGPRRVGVRAVGHAGERQRPRAAVVGSRRPDRCRALEHGHDRARLSGAGQRDAVRVDQRGGAGDHRGGRAARCRPAPCASRRPTRCRPRRSR